MRGLTNVFEEQADGVDTHAATHYAGGSDPIDLAKLGAIPASEKGKTGGVATLDNTGNVPYGQLGNVSRPNLLIGGYFADPINQRGQTSYSGATGDALGYTVDRWRLTGSSPATVTIEDDCVVYSAEGNCNFGQVVDCKLNGKTLTASVLCEEVTNCYLLVRNTDTWVPFGAVELSSAGLCSVAFAVPEDYELDTVRFTICAGSQGESVPHSVKLIAAKLELGSVQTLAHQDADGNWVLNDPPPNKNMEMLKCIQSKADSADSCANKIILHTGNVTAGTTDITAGTTALATGSFYDVYA